MSTNESWTVFGKSGTEWYVIEKANPKIQSHSCAIKIVDDLFELRDRLNSKGFATLMDPHDLRLLTLKPDSKKDFYLQLLLSNEFTIKPADFVGEIVIPDADTDEVPEFKRLGAPVKQHYPRNYKKKRRA